MQIKRLRKILLDRGIENINYYIDGTGKRDQFIGISFKLYGEIYKIFYNRDKIKGYEYSIGWGLNEKSITIMSSNLSYKQLKYYLCNIL